MTIREAFARDGFDVVREERFHGRKGYRAEHDREEREDRTEEVRALRGRMMRN
jgi:hypothetical protein